MGGGIDGGTGGGLIPVHEVYEALFEESRRSSAIAKTGAFLRRVLSGHTEPGFVQSAEAGSGSLTSPDVDQGEYLEFLEAARQSVRQKEGQ